MPFEILTGRVDQEWPTGRARSGKQKRELMQVPVESGKLVSETEEEEEEGEGEA